MPPAGVARIGRAQLHHEQQQDKIDRLLRRLNGVRQRLLDLKLPHDFTLRHCLVDVCVDLETIQDGIAELTIVDELNGTRLAQGNP